MLTDRQMFMVTSRLSPQVEETFQKSLRMFSDHSVEMVLKYILCFFTVQNFLITL